MKYFFLAAFVVAAIAAGCERAHAQTACPTDAVASNAARVCWTNASEMTNGTAIPAAGPQSLATTTVGYGACTATTTPSSTSTLTVPATLGFALIENLAAGVWCFRARHELVDGTAGPWSGWIRKTLTAPTPPKPRAPSITVG
jgi:hypothetical protein